MIGSGCPSTVTMSFCGSICVPRVVIGSPFKETFPDSIKSSAFRRLVIPL